MELRTCKRCFCYTKMNAEVDYSSDAKKHAIIKCRKKFVPYINLYILYIYIL